MEPANLSPRPDPEHDALEALLRQASLPLADDGFSRRVLAALPPARPSGSRAWRRGFIIAGSAAGVVLALSQLGAAAGIRGDWATAQFAAGQVARALGDANALAAVTVAAVSLLYAFTSAIPRRR